MAGPSFQTLALLLDWLLKGLLTLGCAFVADFVFRRANASLRHLLWLVSLGSVILLPLLSVAVPSLNLPLFSMSGLAGRPGISGDPAAAATGGGLAAPQVLVGFYLSGVLCVLAWQIVGRAYVVRLRRKSSAIGDPGLGSELRRLRISLGIGRQVALLSSPVAVIPFSTGVIRPAIVLPCNWSSWHSSVLESVLIHELGHIRRRDCLARIISQLGCCIHWINPFAWIGLRRVMMEQEIACDNLVLESGTRPSAYARNLLSLAKVRGERLHFAMTPLGRRAELRSRLLEILRPRRSRTPLRVAGSLAFAACACVLLLPIAALNIWKSPETGAAAAGISGTPPAPNVPEARPPVPILKVAAPAGSELPDPALFKETISKQIQKMKAEGAPEQKIADYTNKAKAKLADLEKRKQAEAKSKEKPKPPRPE